MLEDNLRWTEKGVTPFHMLERHSLVVIYTESAVGVLTEYQNVL